MNLRRSAVIHLALLCLLALPQARPARAQSPRLVLAFYYAWFDDNSWGPDKMSDMPVAPYRSAERATIERHVREARESGIDALVLSWLGPGNPTEENLRVLLDVAQAQSLRASVDVECTSPFLPDLNALSSALEHLARTHIPHPAFARSSAGQPIVFFWRQQRYSLAQWAALRDALDPQRAMLWIAEGDDPAWLQVFDGLHFYSVTWPINTNPEYNASKMRARVDAYNEAHGTQRVWVSTAMPGYDDTRVAGRTQTYAWPRSPAYYERTWRAAIASDPEMIVITSYNEWPEGTMIEPSVSYGRTYLELTARLAALYKGGPPQRSAEPQDVPTATPTTTQTPTSTPRPTTTATPTSTPSPTATAMPTFTPSPTWTPTAPPTATCTSTATSTPSPSPSPSPTRTTTPTATATPGPTRTFPPRSAYTLQETPQPTVPASQSADRVLPCGASPIHALALVGLVLAARAPRRHRTRS